MNKHGFTLVELLVAVSVFLTATIAFGFILRMGANSVEAAASLSDAGYLLQTQMEEIRNYPFKDLPYLNGRTFGNGSGDIKVTPILADLLRIDLKLNWDPNKVPLVITTLRSRY